MQSQLYRALLIDDEAKARTVLRQLIERFCPKLQICAEADSVDTALAAIQIHEPAIIFLDIDLRTGNGFDVLDAYPDPEFKVVFTTAHDDFALKAFKYRALHYLLKPIDPQDLIAATRDLQVPAGFWPDYHLLQASLKNPEPTPVLVLPSVLGQVRISPEEISYIVADDKYASVVLQSGEKVFISKSLSAIEEYLSKTDFLRPHQSFIVRIDSIRKIQKKEGWVLELKDKTEIPVSRRNKDEVLRVLGM